LINELDSVYEVGSGLPFWSIPLMYGSLVGCTPSGYSGYIESARPSNVTATLTYNKRGQLLQTVTRKKIFINNYRRDGLIQSTSVISSFFGELLRNVVFKYDIDRRLVEMVIVNQYDDLIDAPWDVTLINIKYKGAERQPSFVNQTTINLSYPLVSS